MPAGRVRDQGISALLAFRERPKSWPGELFLEFRPKKGICAAQRLRAGLDDNLRGPLRRVGADVGDLPVALVSEQVEEPPERRDARAPTKRAGPNRGRRRRSSSGPALIADRVGPGPRQPGERSTLQGPRISQDSQIKHPNKHRRWLCTLCDRFVTSDRLVRKSLWTHWCTACR